MHHRFPRLTAIGDPARRDSPILAVALVCLAAVATATNYTNHGPMLGLIAAEFGLSSAEAGVVATAYFLGTASTMLFGGIFADRFGPRPVLTVGLALVTLSNLASGPLASSFPALLLWRTLGGIGSGSSFAAGASYTREAFPKAGAHLAQGLYGASFLLGSGITLLYMPALAGEAHDWRSAFFLSGLGVAACWLAWVRLAPHGPGARRGPGTGLGAALRVRNTWLLGLCHMCGFGLAIVVSTWATIYLARTFGLPLEAAGMLGSLLLVTGILARSGGGGILERGLGPTLLIRAALLIAVAGLVVMALPLGSVPLAVAGLLLAGLGTGLPYAAVFNGAAVSVPRSPASAQAFVGWGAAPFAVVAPPLVGALLDLTGSFSAGFLALAAFTLAVLASTSLMRPFSFRAAG